MSLIQGRISQSRRQAGLGDVETACLGREGDKPSKLQAFENHGHGVIARQVEFLGHLAPQRPHPLGGTVGGDEVTVCFIN